MDLGKNRKATELGVKPLVTLLDVPYFFIKDASTGTYHLWAGDMFSERRKSICGLNHGYLSTLKEVEIVLTALTAVGKRYAVEETIHLLHNSTGVCGNCFRSFQRRVREADTTLGLVFGAYWVELKAQASKSPTAEEKLMFKPTLIGHQPKTDLVLTSGSEDENMTTSKIIVNIKVEFDLEDGCIEDIMENIQDIKNTASEHGAVDEIVITSDGDLEATVA